MKIFRNFQILLIVELLCIGLLYFNLPDDWKQSKALFHMESLGREISVSAQGENAILITAEKGAVSASQEVEVSDVAHVVLRGDWIEDDVHSYDALIQVRTSTEYQEVSVDFSGSMIFFHINKLTEHTDANKQPNEPQEETPTQPSQPPLNTLSSLPSGSAPIVASLTQIYKDSDIVEMSATTAAKPGPGDSGNANLYHNPEGSMYDIKIEAGAVYVTQNTGVDWIPVPMEGIRIQDSWLYYYRMGNQSFQINENDILIGFAQTHAQPHVIISKDHGKSWYDVLFDCGAKDIIQMAIAPLPAGGYQLAMLTRDSEVLYGSSEDGLDWTFATPYMSGEVFTDLYSFALMSDGVMFITKYEDSAITFDYGKTFLHLRDLAPEIAHEMDVLYMPYEEQGTYCIPLKDGTIAKSKDGMHWEK